MDKVFYWIGVMLTGYISFCVIQGIIEAVAEELKSKRDKDKN